MSIRIHELAKRHNMEGKDMLSLLKERGYVSADTKSVSSTVSKIYEQEIDKEFAAKAGAKPVEAKPAAVVAPVAEPSAPPASQVRMPAGAFVKSAQDIVREKEAKAAALKPAGAPPVPPRITQLAPSRPAIIAPPLRPASPAPASGWHAGAPPPGPHTQNPG